MIQTKAKVVTKAEPEIVFRLSTDNENLPLFFTGYKQVPAIISARTADGLPLKQGCTRVVKNSDGSEIEEIIIRLESPAVQEYKLISGFKPPVSWLVKSANGRWDYVKTATGGTEITWTFNFETRNFITETIFRLAVKSEFQKAQEICLSNLKKYVEQADSTDQITPS
jgi:uncharacterized protein YndB with AHSA1/START domain